MHNTQAIPAHAAGSQRVMALDAGSSVIQRPQTLLWREVGPEQLSTEIGQLGGFELVCS
jgi:hypothetical protein